MTDTHRTHVNDGDEDWIAKYRAALKESPVRQSYFRKLRAAVRRAHQFVVVRVGKVLRHGRQTQSEKPALSSGLRPSAPSPVVAESPNHVRKPNRGQSTSRRPPRKMASSPARSKRSG